MRQMLRFDLFGQQVNHRKFQEILTLEIKLLGTAHVGVDQVEEVLGLSGNQQSRAGLGRAVDEERWVGDGLEDRGCAVEDQARGEVVDKDTDLLCEVLGVGFHLLNALDGLEHSHPMPNQIPFINNPPGQPLIKPLPILQKPLNHPPDPHFHLFRRQYLYLIIQLLLHGILLLNPHHLPFHITFSIIQVLVYLILRWQVVHEVTLEERLCWAHVREGLDYVLLYELLFLRDWQGDGVTFGKGAVDVEATWSVVLYELGKLKVLRHGLHVLVQQDPQRLEIFY